MKPQFTNTIISKNIRNFFCTGLMLLILSSSTLAQIPADPANPTSNSPQCASIGVTMNFTGTAPAGETWYWETSDTGTSTLNAAASYTVTESGTYFVRSQDNTSLSWSAGAGSVTVIVNPDVSNLLFLFGSSSTRCSGGGNITYTATALNSTNITYSIDAATSAGGNNINASTGKLSFNHNWTGTTIITATATGCGSTITATHTVTTYGPVSTPVFLMGSTSRRCLGAESVTYTATATDATGISYSLDPASIAGGNTIDPLTGTVNYSLTWTGSSVITASAAGCSGPASATHTVTTNGQPSVPVFSLGTTSTRCQGATGVTYTATASNTTGITYSLDPLSITGGNTIDSLTGTVSYNSSWTGTTVIRATAAGCNISSIAIHTVTTNPSVTAPVFTLGSTSSRCQGTGLVTYTASSNNSTGITYSLDAASITGGNTISSATGIVNYQANWAGSSTITASASGCNGPVQSTHIVIIRPTVGTPIFALGSTSSRCLGAQTINYSATATNNTGITYSLDLLSTLGGNSINTATGDVTYAPAWAGSSVITATASGCNGPSSATHTVTTRASLGVPVFSSGSSSSRCQGTGTVTYTATAANANGIVYALDASSISGGNTINAATGQVSYAATWSGTSTITATATGCNGPTTSTHTVTITPTLGTVIFALGSSSTRCQGAAVLSYVATSTNSTAITYSLDAASITAGNSINTATGAVTYVAGWSGSSTITATATGCNGPASSAHTVTTTATVGTPVFALGSVSLRSQAAATISYTATATSNTGITYSLDAASLAGGNTINASTGTVTWSASWSGTSVIRATATGCNGPLSSTHTVTINAILAETPLYLSDPGQILDRNDPVALGLSTTVQSVILSTAGTTNISFTQSPALSRDLTIKAQNISVMLYLSVTSGSMPANPAITATLKYGATNIITLNNPTYSGGILTWSGALGADVVIPSGQAIVLQITTAQAAVSFKINYHSMTSPSRITLLPVSTFIDISSFDLYDAPYPAGNIKNSGLSNALMYARAVVSNPYGYRDITGLNITIAPGGSTVAATCVDSSASTRTYQYAWTTPATAATYDLMATAREGYENIIKNSDLHPYIVCSLCPPTAVADSASGAGGAPMIIDVLLNDYDPNNNIKPSTLTVVGQGNNGSGVVSNNKIVYLPNGSFAGNDTLRYQVCDSTGLCATAQVFITINPLLVDPCSEATESHVFYLPFSENEVRMALDSSTNLASFPSNNIRTVISMKMPYPGMVIVWDHWEDGYENNPLNPMQSTTEVWGDGNPYNGIAPGYANDIIPAGGSIVLDNTIPTNPRVASNTYYDGRDKVYSSGNITMTQVSGEPSIMAVQCMKTNVSAVADYGTLFTIPVGQNYNSQDFRYTSLFIRASENNTLLNIDKDNNGTFETTATINEGQVYLVNGGVLSGATVTASAPVGVDLHFGGNDQYSSRDVPIFPATWYYSSYYSPVPTTGRALNPADTNAVYLYNALNRVLTINWTSGIPSSGSISIPAKSVVRFPLALSSTAAYKFVNPTGESFTAIEMCDSYTPGGGGNGGQEFDWSFNLIAENRLTDFATVAWAPGSTDGTRNDNPVWVTPTANTTIYVKYDGNISGTTGSLSPCGLRYDVSYALNAGKHKRLLDPSDNDQGGLAVFTCDGTKLAAVYGEDASSAVTGSPSWDVGSTIQPFCKQKLIFANDDYARTMINAPVTISVLSNDYGFLSVVDPSSVTTAGFLQPLHGTVTVNANGTILYTPNAGYVGLDTFEYNVCSTPTPIVCDYATVYVDISSCPAPYNENVIAGMVFKDSNGDGINNDGGTGVAGEKVYLYIDGNCDQTINANELKDSVITDASGTYQFISYPERYVYDDFDGAGGTNTCASGSDGNASWLSNWTDAGDPSPGFCNNAQSAANTDVEIIKDGAFSYALRLKDNNVSATRTVNLSGASYAFLSFSYRRKSASLTAGKDIIVQASTNGSTFGTIFTIAGDGTTDPAYVNVYNQDITSYAAATTYIRFLTNNNVADNDTVYIDNVKIEFLRYPQCYIVKFDSTTMPANYYTTTTVKHNLTATSSTTCMAPYDFGINRRTISLSGTLFHDANGLTDNLINGTATGTADGEFIYAYLVDTSGKVVNKTLVNSVNGTYSFTGVGVQSTYTLSLSTTNVNIGATPPADASLPGIWNPTGDAYGTNNTAGSGIKPGTPTCSVVVQTGLTNISGVNFGIEQLPESIPQSLTIPQPTPGMLLTLNGGTNPPIPPGTDPEDGSLGSGNKIAITSVPFNCTMKYNGVTVTNGQVISNFNPSLLKLQFTAATIGSLSTSFLFAYVDAAGKQDPTPATYTIFWASPLPVILNSLYGKANNCDAVLQWKTSQESDLSKFVIEQSTDGISFKQVFSVRASNNPNGNAYQVTVEQLASNAYYRVVIIGNDRSKQYSEIIAVHTNCADNEYLKITPNPVVSTTSVLIHSAFRGNATLLVESSTGQRLNKTSVHIYTYDQLVKLDMEQYTAGLYLVYLLDDKGTKIGETVRVLKN